MKYTKKRAQLICEELKALKSKTEACLVGEITTVTFYEWYNNLPEFKKMVDEAYDTGLELTKHQAIQAIKNQFGKNWTSAAWWLERKYPDEFGKQDKLDQTMTINQVQIHYIVPEEQQNKLDDIQIIKIENGENES